MTMHRYQPRSPLQAIDPKAFFGLFASFEEIENEGHEDVTVVTIRGPLSQHSDWWEDSYEAIRGRVEEACQQAAPVVALRIDSPGGDVAGLFDTARAIRQACDRAGKRLVAHVEGQCCSAAYALATAAESITASRSAEVGSIGVIAVRVDETKALDKMGYKVDLITSGARKADGWSCVPMAEDERAAFQNDIDALAAEFFDLVSIRRGISTDQVAAFEAASFRGSAALKAGLVDELGSFDHLIASLGAAMGDPMDEKEKDARDALQSIAEDEERSEEEREKARRALAALDDDDTDAEGEEDDADAEGEENDEDAEGDDDEPAAENGDDDDDDEATAASTSGTVSASTAGAIAAHGSNLEKRLAKLERREASAERKRLIAAHGGVPKGMAALLATKPLSEVKALLAELPKPKKPKLGDAAATATVAGTRGGGQDQAAQLPPEESKAMRQAMGLDAEKFGVVERGNALLLGAPESDGGES